MAEDDGDGEPQSEEDEEDKMFKNSRFSKTLKKKSKKRQKADESSSEESSSEAAQSSRKKQKREESKIQSDLKKKEKSSEEEDDAEEFQGKFVAQKAFTNKDLKEELFGEKKRNGSGFTDKDSKINFLNGRPYSQTFYKLMETRQSLPAWQARKKIVDLVKDLQVVVLQGDTGSGKTTQVPQFLLESGLADGKCIACTQPRRVAAMSVAARVAQEADVQLGEEVGYTIRFEDKSSQQTQLKYLTDGMLLRESMIDPLLKKYGIIILDEAHERTLATDILFGLLKDILTKRKDLRIVVMSATLNAERFQKYFTGAPLLDIPGRMYPVEILYTPKPVQDYLTASIDTVIKIHKEEAEGDILLFLTGEEEIEQACQQIKDECRKLGDVVGKMMVVPLYSSLPPQQQQKIFD